jgi:hypothetical protein
MFIGREIGMLIFKKENVSQNTEWEDCSLSYICDCGHVLVLDSQSDMKKCECGRIYSLWSNVVEWVSDNNNQ